jgi:hypothetical protein
MATAKAKLTQARLKELLRYDPETGVFTWLITRSRRARRGSVAGSLHVSGYIHIIVDGCAYKAHRLAWLYVHGVWPDEIDHINCIKDDNAFSNLREVSRLQNMKNIRRFTTNKSGFKGVGFHGGKWRARITCDRKPMFLGHFDTPEMAFAAYCAAARRVHGEFARVE